MSDESRKQVKMLSLEMFNRWRTTVALTTIVSLLFVISAGHLSKASDTEQPPPSHHQHNHALTRKSIVFDLKTPKVFYCPQEKPSDVDKMIVKAQPLDKLCEFDGKSRPKSAHSDCYNDVDETEFACDEKKRFMIRLDLASEGLDSGTEGIDDLDYILAKSKKKASQKEKSKKAY